MPSLDVAAKLAASRVRHVVTGLYAAGPPGRGPGLAVASWPCRDRSTGHHPPWFSRAAALLGAGRGGGCQKLAAASRRAGGAPAFEALRQWQRSTAKGAQPWAGSPGGPPGSSGTVVGLAGTGAGHRLQLPAGDARLPPRPPLPSNAEDHAGAGGVARAGGCRRPYQLSEPAAGCGGAGGPVIHAGDRGRAAQRFRRAGTGGARTWPRHLPMSGGPIRRQPRMPTPCRLVRGGEEARRRTLQVITSQGPQVRALPAGVWRELGLSSCSLIIVLALSVLFYGAR